MHTQLITSVLLEKSNTVLLWMPEYALNTQPVNWFLYLSPSILPCMEPHSQPEGRAKACLWLSLFSHSLVLVCGLLGTQSESVSQAHYGCFIPPPPHPHHDFPISFFSLSIVLSNGHPLQSCNIKLLPARTFEKCSKGGTLWTLTQVKQIHVKLALFWSH